MFQFAVVLVVWLFGNLNGSGYANGIQHAYSYNALNRLTALNILKGSAPVSGAPTGPTPVGPSLQNYTYQLNKNGHRTQIAELGGRTVTNVLDKGGVRNSV